jgi:hypothetical protein
VTTPINLHSQLLLAAFAEPQRAVPAWMQWQAQSDWQSTVDFDAYLLLPRIFHNLGGLGVEDALFMRLKGVVKHNWVANTTTLNGIASVEKLLQRNAITAVLLPPCALLLGDRSMAMSPGEPISYRISRSDAQRVARLLCAQGWRSVAASVPRWCLPGYIAATRNLRIRADELTLDLQWMDSPGPERNPVDDISATRRVFHGQSICTLGAPESIRLLLSAPNMGTELARVSRALMLLQHGADYAGWHCLLQLLHRSGSGYADLVESLKPAAGDANQHSVQPALQQELQHSTQPSSQSELASHSPPDTRANTLWKHYQLRWRHYRSALGEEFSSAAALCCLPGYLMGRWELQRFHEIVPAAYRTLRFQWQAHRGGGQGKFR